MNSATTYYRGASIVEKSQDNIFKARYPFCYVAPTLMGYSKLANQTFFDACQIHTLCYFYYNDRRKKSSAVVMNLRSSYLSPICYIIACLVSFTVFRLLALFNFAQNCYASHRIRSFCVLSFAVWLDAILQLFEVQINYSN